MTPLEVIHTDKAPKAIGPYSQAIRVGSFIHTAGQVALDPATGQLVEGGIEAQTRQALQNLSHVLEAAGSSLRHVVKTTVFMKDIGEFAQMNTIYGEMFGEHKPARSTVQVAALPRGAAVEIECVAVVKE
jgi:2-iminobutanoate/2-iminopropanoate deaminase